LEIYERLNRGKWERPSDTMAVYTEIEPGKRWGVRVTLIKDYARVEAIDGPKCCRYQAPRELSAEVRPPSIVEQLRGVRFVDKLMAEVEAKRLVAARRNA
jgi:hypothetical protein